jgi:PAS domain S-box-containing protein
MTRTQTPPATMTDLLFEKVSVGLCLVAPDSTIIRANAEWLRSTGFTEEQVLGESIVDLFPATRDMAIAMHARARAGHRVEVPRHAQVLNGRETWWEGSIEPVAMEGGTGLLITAHEVTPAAAPGDSGVLQHVIDGSPSIVFLKDLDGRFITINKTLEKLLGMTREQLAGKTDFDIFPPDRAEYYRAHDRVVIESQRMLQVEEVVDLPDGKHQVFLANRFPVYDGAGRLYAVCAISHDVTERRRADEALRESEERYRTLFAKMGEGFAIGEAICDAEGRPVDFRFLEMNDAFERQAGLRHEATRGRPMREVLPHLEQFWIDTYCGVALGGPEVRFEHYNQDLDRHFSVNCFSPLRGRFAILFSDITEQKRAEAAIRASESQLRRLYDSGMIGVLHFDINGAILDANDRFLSMVGYSRADLESGQVAWDKMTPSEYRGADEFAVSELKDRGVDTPYEKEYIRKDGSRVAILIGAATYDDARHRGIAFVLDITERKRTEEALRASEERWNAAIENFSEGAIIATEDEQVIYWNPAARAMHGFRGERDGIEPLARTPDTFELWTPDGQHLLTLDEWPMRRIKRGETVRRLELRLRRPDQGWERFVSYSGAMVRTAGGERLIFLSVTDLTEQRRAEMALRETDRRKDEFLGMLSHELRNPLAPIRNSTYILQHAAPGSDQVRRAQSVIQRQTEHLTRLVDDLLDVTRIARGKIELRRAHVDLREVVARAAEDFRLVFNDRAVHFEVTLPGEKLGADADATRITQVVGNLLHNASKFTRRGDSVRLSLSARDGAAEMTVSDTGAGMDRELLPRIFDAFVQGERTLARTDGGLGLGLALVKGITELHGGTVEARSAGKGRGSEFIVRLPLVGGTETASAPAPGVDRRSGGRRVLVVDDNSDAAESLADLVRMLGHPVEVAFDGPSAIAAAKTSRPDVVLCDIGLPGMDGYEVADALRAAGLDGLQLVAVSGYAQPEDVKRAIEAGFDAHVAKPCDPKQIERLLA